MEFENSLGNQARLAELRTRVESYLEQAFKTNEAGDASDSSDGQPAASKLEPEESASGDDESDDGDKEMESEGESAEEEEEEGSSDE